MPPMTARGAGAADRAADLSALSGAADLHPPAHPAAGRGAMSRGRRHHPLWSRRRVLVTPQGSAVTNAIQGLILTPTTMLASLELPSAPAMMPSQPSKGDG